ncbi:MAG: nucleotidyltransferase domain-containing protein [Anaerolineales bacterium]
MTDTEARRREVALYIENAHEMLAVAEMNPRFDKLIEQNERDAIDAFIGLLRRDFAGRIRNVVLFGSKARGDSHVESDIDVLIIADAEDWQFRHAIIDVSSDVSLEYDVLIAPRIISQQRWAQLEDGGTGLYENIARDGIPLDFATTGVS